MQPGPRQIFNSRIVKINFPTSGLLAICYEFRSNVTIQPAFPFVGLSFTSDSVDVLDKNIVVVPDTTPPTVAPPRVHPISDEMMKKLLMFTAAPADFSTFNSSYEGITFPNNAQFSTIFFNLGKIKALLGKAVTKIDVKADKPTVSGLYTGPHHPATFAANVFAHTVAEAQAAMLGQLNTLPEFVSLIGFDFTNEVPGTSPPQYFVQAQYVKEPQVVKAASWAATAYTYKIKTRTFRLATSASAQGLADPAIGRVSQLTKKAGFGLLNETFKFTIDLKTLEVS